MKGTIKSGEEISQLFKSGSKFSSKGFLALYSVRDNNTPLLDPSLSHHAHTTTHLSNTNGRLAFAAGKKLGTAPERSRAKRRLREAAHKAGAPWDGYDVVLVARAGALTMEFSELTQELTRLKKESMERFKGNSGHKDLEEQVHQPLEGAKKGLKREKPLGREVLDFIIGIPRTIALSCIFIYRHAISPLLPPSCGYVPTCSEYAMIAFSRFGFWKGLWLSVKRIGRCHPFAKGGYDPVPEKSSGKIA